MKYYEDLQPVSDSKVSSLIKIAKEVSEFAAYHPCDEDKKKDSLSLSLKDINRVANLKQCVEGSTLGLGPLGVVGYHHLCRRLWWWKWAGGIDKPHRHTFNFNLRLDLSLFSVNASHLHSQEEDKYHKYQVQVQKQRSSSRRRSHSQSQCSTPSSSSSSLLGIAVLFLTVNSMKMCDIGVSLYNRYFGGPSPGPPMPTMTLLDGNNSSGGSSTSSSSSSATTGYPCGRRKNHHHRRHQNNKSKHRMVVLAKVKCQEPPPPLQLCTSSTTSTSTSSSEEEAVVKPRKVQFKEDAALVHILEFEDDEESRQNRMLYWEFFAADRCRFKDRIHRTQEALGDIFSPEHRRKMKGYQERYLLEEKGDSKKRDEDEEKKKGDSIPPEIINNNNCNNVLTC